MVPVRHTVYSFADRSLDACLVVEEHRRQKLFPSIFVFILSVCLHTVQYFRRPFRILLTVDCTMYDITTYSSKV
jgi:hypothetical protein